MHCVLITMVTHHWYVIIIIIILYSLTFLAVIPSVTWGRAKIPYIYLHQRLSARSISYGAVAVSVIVY